MKKYIEGKSCGKNFRPLTLKVPEILSKNYKKRESTLTPSSG